MPFVYAGQLARIDLSSRRVMIEPIPADRVERYVLGSGLAAAIFYREMDPALDALDSRSPLIILNGLLSGTFAPSGCRSSWCARSPLTGIWNESSMGGHFGSELRWAGFDGLILTGRAESPVYIWIDGATRTIEIRPADHVWGLDTYQTHDLLRAETDGKAQVACIGPAGEKLVRYASILQGGHVHSRAAGRGGMGAVLGSKNLKAIVVRGKSRATYANLKELNRLVRDDNAFIQANSEAMKFVGTAGGIAVTEKSGDLPIDGWRGGNLPGAENISGKHIHDTIWVRDTFCQACPVGCGKEIKIDAGEYAGTSGACPEYEALALLGANLQVTELEPVVKANDLCNYYGLDTMSTGGSIAFLFEAIELGLISREQCGAIDARWGNGAAVVALVEAIAKREGIGNFLAEGVNRAADALGPTAEELNLTVKGLEMPGHDPRANVSMGLNYATANRGACHLEALTYFNGAGITIPSLGYPEVLPRADSAFGAQLAYDWQNYCAIYNPLGLCKFLIKAKVGPDMVAELLNKALGWSWAKEDVIALGERLFNLKRLINLRYGVTAADDRLPVRLTTLPRPTGGSAGVLPDMARMLPEYYALRGWDERGAPTRERLEKLGVYE